MKEKSGFTLIELLVVIAIIAILAAILFPVFASARERARTASCLSNVGQITRAVLQYADDHKGFWPFSVDFEDKNNWPSNSSVQNAPYLNQIIQPYAKSREIWRCPSDKGITWQKTGPLGRAQERVKNCYKDIVDSRLPSADKHVYASYVTNRANSFTSSTVPNPVKMDQAPDPTRAMVVFDPWQVRDWNNGPGADDWNGQWHARKFPDCSWNMGFFDGHARNVTFREIRYPKDAPANVVSLFDGYWVGRGPGG